MIVLNLGRARWRKSSRSTDQANCVEVALVSETWQKSSFSTDTRNCVEVAFAGPAVGVRDSKDTGGAVLAFPLTSWREFLHNHN